MIQNRKQWDAKKKIKTNLALRKAEKSKVGG